MERRGVPSVTIVCQEFAALAEVAAQAAGQPSLPMVKIPYIVPMLEGEVPPIADRAFEEIISELTAPVPESPVQAQA